MTRAGAQPNAPILATRNILKIVALVAVFVAGFGALGWWLGGVRAAAVFFFVALLTMSTLLYYADRVVIGMVNAREMVASGAPGFVEEVERLGEQTGAGEVRLYLIDDLFPRAFALGRGPGRGTLVVSRGFLGMGSPSQLEGVIAHELAHIRHRDVLTQTLAVVLAGALLELSRVGGPFQRAFLFGLAPLAASLTNLMLSPGREFTADTAAAVACESPLIVAEGLTQLNRATEMVDFAASPATEPLYTTNPFEPEGVASMFSTHPPLAKRIEQLMALEGRASAT